MVEVSVVNVICDLYAARVPMREIVERVNLSPSAVFRVISNVRMLGDVRVQSPRRLAKNVRHGLVLGLLRCNEPVGLERMAEVIWGDLVPGSWRVILRLLIRDLRKQGVVVRWTKAGYVLG